MRFLLPLLILLLVTGAGCSPAAITTPPTPGVVSAESAQAWEPVHPHIDQFIWNDEATGHELVLYRFSPEDVTMRWEDGDARFISEWSASMEDELLVVNGIYFHEDFSPSGYFETQNARVGTRAFDLDRSGLITLSPAFSIQSDYFLPPEAGVTEAAQSYPFLVRDGAPAVSEDSGLLARRTFMGTDRDGFVYIGVAPMGGISLYELGHLLPTLPIQWDDAINLDGGPSTGVALADTELIDSYAPIPIVLVVSARTGSE